MAENATIARPYARAAFASAVAGNALASWSDALQAASLAVRDPRVAGLIGNPRVASSDLVALLGETGHAGSDTGIMNFLRLLAENGRLALLPNIAEQFHAMRALHENTADVEVVSAMELSAAQTQALSAALAKRLGKTIRLHPRIDQSLIGGALVRAGDFVVDGSLRGRLAQLTQELSN
ncbi:MAG: F0F1 ATP synthase subunit delta [Steroidobacteraceae bacterium]